MSETTIYHNPRCSKSRQTLALLEEHGVTPNVVLYLETPPDRKTLVDIIERLGITPRDLLRKGEESYKTLGLADTSLADDKILEAMLKAPILIERPIVVRGKKAALGRPPENVLALIDS